MICILLHPQSLLNFLYLHLFLHFVRIYPTRLVHNPHLGWGRYICILLEVLLVLSLIKVLITATDIFATSLLLTLAPLTL